MQRQDFERLDAALDELFELDHERQQQYLAQLRGQDVHLAERLAELLEADRISSGVLDQPAVEGLGTGVAATTAEIGDRFGAWVVTSRLGSGGMGEVFEVERDDGVFRGRAALKLLRRGFDDPLSEARFRTEREVLGHLHHPGVARILDGGTTGEGRLYYVMELVAGRAITTAGREMPPDARLRMLIAACHAVEAAHQAFVVHRDLKPSNILVTDDGTVKLLDFGIAKWLEPGADVTRTSLENRALTPAYAAPEQILGEPVSTASDVYALGVVLFELLTGRLPHDRRTTSLAELIHRVDAEQPPRLSTSGIDLPGATRALRADLDAITQRALAREPARRYRTAAALADDLERALAGHPVLARPDSLGYRSGRFVRRHRLAVGLVLVAALSLVGGLAAALRSAASARAAATQAAAEAARADLAAAHARTEQARATAIKDFVLSILREANPLQRERGRALEIEELLDLTEARIDEELAGDPLLQASLWDDLAETRAASGDLERANVLIDKALAAKRSHLDPLDPALAESLANRASFAVLGSRPADALVDADAAIAIVVLHGTEPTRLAAELATIRTNALNQLGRTDEALAEAQHAFELHRAVNGEAHHETTMQLSNVAMLQLKLGHAADARQTFERVIQAVEREVGPDHGLLYYPVKGLGRAALAEGDLEAARSAQGRAMTLATTHFGADSRAAAEVHAELGRIAAAAGLNEQAAVAYRRAVAILQQVAPQHPLIAELSKLPAPLPE